MAESNVVPTQSQNEPTIKMNLMNDVGIGNAKGFTQFKRGMSVDVPRNMADDVARIDFDASQAKQNLVRQPQNFNVQAGANPNDFRLNKL